MKQWIKTTNGKGEPLWTPRSDRPTVPGMVRTIIVFVAVAVMAACVFAWWLARI